MKKVISIIMAVVLLLTSSLGCAEGVVKLPAKLVEIETEAFSGDSSLTVADVPYGTQSISSRAFAGSTLEKIYIPRTVTYIAEDAFDGTDVLILSPESCYAHTYAEENGLRWADCGDHYEQDEQDAIEDLQNSSISLSETKIEAIELLSTAGVTDPEELEFIRGYNKLALEVNQEVSAYNAFIDEGVAAIDALADSISDFNTSGEEGSFSFSGGTVQMEISGLPQDGTKFTEAVLSEDGSMLILTTDSGDTYYAVISDGKMQITAVPPYAKSRAAQSISRERSEELVKYYEATLLALKSAYNSAAVWYEGIDDLAINKINNIRWGSERMLKFAERYASEATNAQFKAKLSAKINELKYYASDKILPALEKVDSHKLSIERVLPIANIPLQIAGVVKLIENWKKVNEIYDHGHPTENDITPEAIKESKYLGLKIESLWHTFSMEAVLLTVELCSSIALVAGKNPWAEVPALGALGLETVLWWREDIDFKELKKIDASLHTTVSGIVRAADTKTPLQYVSVISGGQQVWTDSTGAYTIYLLPGEHTITFKRDGYQDREITVTLEVTLESGDKLQRDIELSAAEVTLTGVIYDSKTGAPLPSVTILCGDRMELSGIDGSYSISLPVGEQTISYMLDGYEEQTVTLLLAEGTTSVSDIMLNRKVSGEATVTGVIRDSKTGEPLSGVTILCCDIMTLTDCDGFFRISFPAGFRVIRVMTDDHICFDVAMYWEAGSTCYFEETCLHSEGLPS